MTPIKHTALNPQGQPRQSRERLPLAPRLDSLDGKTIAFVDVGFGGGYEFLEQMQGWFARHLPATKTMLVRKPGNMLTDTPEFWAELKQKCNSVIFGVGG